MTHPTVDVIVLSRDAGPLPPDLESALRRQQGVRLIVHRVIGAAAPTEANRWQTIARARNNGKSAGTSPWVMFLDDDVVPDAYCVRRLLEGLQARPAYGALAADYLGESGGNVRGHVGMGATLFRRGVLARLRFRWRADRCECQCCCDDLRAMGIGIAYLPAARARHLAAPGKHSAAGIAPAEEQRVELHKQEAGSVSLERPEPSAGDAPAAGHTTTAAPRILAAFDRAHYGLFRGQFLGSLRARGNHEQVTAVAYGLDPGELHVLASQPNVEVCPIAANGVVPAVRRLHDFQTVLERLPRETPVAYWDAGDVVFQDSLALLWQEVAAHPDKLLAVREPQGHPRNPVVAAWTLSIRDAQARRRAFDLLSTRPFLNSGFAAGTAATLLRYLRGAERLRAGRELAGSADWGDQTALNLFCHLNPQSWRETEEGWNYCLCGRRRGEVALHDDGRFFSRRGTSVRVVHGNAHSMAQYLLAPQLLGPRESSTEKQHERPISGVPQASLAGTSVEQWLSLFRDDVPRGLPDGWERCRAVWEAHRRLARECLNSLPRYPEQFDGRGIVICAGGIRYFVCAYVAAKMLRHLGCSLPIQFWHLADEIDDEMRSLVAPLGVACIDADALNRRRSRPYRILKGWELKSFAILQSPYREVLLLDADNVPVVDPSFLLETREFRERGAIFWPDDVFPFAPNSPVWEIFEVPPRHEPQFESGQLVIDKRRTWRALNLAMHYNEHSDFYYRHVHGDKETFHLAFLRTNTPFAMPSRPVHGLAIHGVRTAFCQHDFAGRRVFQHRIGDKWRLDGKNRHLADFWFEDLCRYFIDELAARWSGRRSGRRRLASTGADRGHTIGNAQLP
ncbi:MAG TPA: glycosyltransferase [Pirellulales bacterium]|nr:glycosyltransferase [Pirellulales bacterium]